MMRFIYILTMARSRKMIIRMYGKDFYIQFRNRSKRWFRKALKGTPDIGKSIFSFNYAYAPSYVAWYKAMMELGINQKQADELMWRMNEKMLLTVPKPLLHMVGRTYLNSFRKKAKQHILRQERGELHPFDWEIEYKDINENEFMIKIKKCGFIAYADSFDAGGILPGICAVDYIVAYYMKNGFHRTKTLGCGDDCCDCRYALNGSCPLKPEKGQK